MRLQGIATVYACLRQSSAGLPDRVGRHLATADHDRCGSDRWARYWLGVRPTSRRTMTERLTFNLNPVSFAISWIERLPSTSSRLARSMRALRISWATLRSSDDANCFWRVFGLIVFGPKVWAILPDQSSSESANTTSSKTKLNTSEGVRRSQKTWKWSPNLMHRVGSKIQKDLSNNETRGVVLIGGPPKNSDVSRSHKLVRLFQASVWSPGVSRRDDTWSVTERNGASRSWSFWSS